MQNKKKRCNASMQAPYRPDRSHEKKIFDEDNANSCCPQDAPIERNAKRLDAYGENCLHESLYSTVSLERIGINLKDGLSLGILVNSAMSRGRSSKVRGLDGLL